MPLCLRQVIGAAGTVPERPSLRWSFKSGGMLLVTAATLWILLSAWREGGSPLPMMATVFSVSAAFLVARVGARRSASIVPAVVFGVALIALTFSPLASVAGGPGEGPFGYANARAAYFLVGGTAGLLLARRSPGRWRWLVVGTALVMMMLVPAFADARTATIASIGVGVTALVAVWRAPRRAIAATFAAAAFIVLVGTTWVASHDVSSDMRAVLDPRRVALWGEAFDLVIDHPLTGVGPGRFAEVSNIEAADSDAGWAHHEFLQQGAETGVLGVTILIGFFAWGFVRVWASSGPADQAMLGAAILGSLAVMASTDYVLHFPLIPASVAALVGGATTFAPHAVSEWRPSSLARRAVKLAALPWGLLAGRRGGDTVILLYHRVGAGDREIDVPLERFEHHMAMLADRQDVRTLDEALSGPGGLVVTFDDGLADFHEKALPVLVRHHIPALLYLATGLIGSDPGALSWSQLEEAVQTGLVAVGGHTHGHADLSRLSEADAEEEVVTSKALIEDTLAVPCRHFAYPWAVGSPAAERAVRRHFDTAALHAWRINRRDRLNRYQLGRTPILRSDEPFFFRAKLQGMLDAEALAYRALGRGPWGRG